jgi:hypothetical protein
VFFRQHVCHVRAARWWCVLALLLGMLAFLLRPVAAKSAAGHAYMQLDHEL